MKKKYLWMCIDIKDDDRPIAVADSGAELARMLGLKCTTIYEEMSRAKRKGWRCRYIKVEDEKESDE